MAKKSSSNNGLLAICVFLLPFLVLTGFGSYAMIRNSYTALTSDWRSVQAVVTSSRSFSRSGRNWVCYEYAANGEQFTGYDLSPGRTGDVLTVYYNAYRPDTSSVEPYETTGPALTVLITIGMIVAFVAVGGAFAVCFSTLWSDYRSKSPVSPGGTKFWFVRIVIAGICFTLAWYAISPFLETLQKNTESREWPSVKAIVLDVDIEERIRVQGAGRSNTIIQYYYVPCVRYSYEIKGQKFEGNNIAADDLELSYGYAHTIISGYPPGSVSKAFVNPENAGDAVLIPYQQTLRYRTLYEIIGIILMLLGVGSLLLPGGIFHSKSESETV